MTDNPKHQNPGPAGKPAPKEEELADFWNEARKTHPSNAKLMSSNSPSPGQNVLRTYPSNSHAGSVVRFGSDIEESSDGTLASPTASPRSPRKNARRSARGGRSPVHPKAALSSSPPTSNGSSRGTASPRTSRVRNMAARLRKRGSRINKDDWGSGSVGKSGSKLPVYKSDDEDDLRFQSDAEDIDCAVNELPPVSENPGQAGAYDLYESVMDGPQKSHGMTKFGRMNTKIHPTALASLSDQAGDGGTATLVEQDVTAHAADGAVKPQAGRALSLEVLDKGFMESEDTIGNILSVGPRLTALTVNMTKYVSVCFSIRGRAWPWKPLLFTSFYVFILWLFHKQGYGLVPEFDFVTTKSNYRLIGVVVGYQLKQEALQANARWWEAREHWQTLMTNCRTLIIFLVAACDCPGLIEEAVTHVVATQICIKNLLMDMPEEIWRAEVSMVLRRENVDRLMQYSRRARVNFCIYAVQRCCEVMIQTDLLKRPTIRDINPKLVIFRNMCGRLTQIRLTPIPWIQTLHVRLLVVIFLILIPFFFLGVNVTKGEMVMDWNAIIFYEMLVGYAYCGIEHMAADIENPFDASESSHPLDLYVFLILMDARYLMGKRFGGKINFLREFEKKYIAKINTWISGFHDHKIMKETKLLALLTSRKSIDILKGSGGTENKLTNARAMLQRVPDHYLEEGYSYAPPHLANWAEHDSHWPSKQQHLTEQDGTARGSKIML